MFHFKSAERAKRVAKALGREMADRGHNVTWSECLEMVARMYSWPNWQTLNKNVGKGQPSKDDADCPPDVRKARYDLHVSVLTQRGLPVPMAQSIVEAICPTGRSNRSEAAERARQDPFVVAALAMIEKEMRAGKWSRAADIAVVALQKAQPLAKEAFIPVLEECGKHWPMAKVNLAVACLMSNGVARDVTRARKILEEVVEGDEGRSGVTPEQLGHVHALLGDIYGGTHGTPPDKEKALRHYKLGAAGGHPQASFNAALAMAGAGGRYDYDEIAAMYRIGADQQYPSSMTNLALMMVRGEIQGDPAEMRRLIEGAARQGDDIATNLLPHLAQLELAVTMIGEVDDDGDVLDEMRFLQPTDPEIWITYLREKAGWTLTDINRESHETGARIAYAVGASGERVPVHLAGMMYQPGDDDDVPVRNIKRMLEIQKRAILIFNFPLTTANKRQDGRMALFVGQYFADGRWTDIFLRPNSGLDDLVTQREQMDRNPGVARDELFGFSEAFAWGHDIYAYVHGPNGSRGMMFGR